MAHTHKIPGTVEAWENGTLGEDLDSAKAVSSDKASAIEEALGLQMISIRLDKELIETFKNLAKYHKVGYQPLMRDALRRFADAEMKRILAESVNAQVNGAKDEKTGATQQKKAA